MKKIIQKQKEAVLSELCQKIVARDWSQKMVDETPEDVINYVEDNNNQDEDLKLRKKQYDNDLKNVETNKLHIEADVFAYNTLSNLEEEIKQLLK